MLGNGSDELISLLAMACDVPGATILAPLPGFVMYEMSARLQGLKFVGVPLTATFELDAEAMLAAIEHASPGAHLHRLPEQPDRQPVRRARRSSASSPPSARRTGWSSSTRPTSRSRRAPGCAKVGSLPHVLVLRTLSKFGLAGVRLGYLAGPAALIDEVDKVRPPYNIGALNAEATLFALEHADEFARQAALLRGERARLQSELAATPGVTAFPSEANMILVRVPGAAAVFQAHEVARRAGQERRRAASAPRRLPAPDGRHAGGKYPDDRRLARQPAMTAVLPIPPPCRRGARRSAATPRRRRSASASISTASARPRSRPASASSTTCSTRSPATARSTSRSTPRATCTSTATTPSRTSASPSAWRSARRSATSAA